MRLESTWETDGDFKRQFHLEAASGDTVKKFDDYPTLDELRNVEQQQQERLVLTDIGVPCSNCSSEITNRFGADPRGNLLCWDCAVTTDHSTEVGIRVNTDPSDATISASKLYKKSLCDHVINVATGCRHGCKFCYVPTTPGYETRETLLNDHVGVDDAQEEWGSYLLYRDDLPARLHYQLEAGEFDNLEGTDRGRGVVMLSSGTDPYQDRRAGQISRATIHELISHGIPVRILTRSSIVAKDIDLFCSAGGLVKVGSSIPSFNRELINTLEPGAPPPLTRWETLDMLQVEGVSVFVSMSPTYPTMTEHMLHRLLTRFIALSPDVIFHEPINPRGENFKMMITALEEQGLAEAAEKFSRLQNPTEWVGYALRHLNKVQQKARDLDAPPIHSWPDRDLLTATEGHLHEQLVSMRKSASPESFTADCSPGYANAHSPLFNDYEEVEHLVHPERIR